MNEDDQKVLVEVPYDALTNLFRALVPIMLFSKQYHALPPRSNGDVIYSMYTNTKHEAVLKSSDLHLLELSIEELFYPKGTIGGLVTS